MFEEFDKFVFIDKKNSPSNLLRIRNILTNFFSLKHFFFFRQNLGVTKHFSNFNKNLIIFKKNISLCIFVLKSW